MALTKATQAIDRFRFRVLVPTQDKVLDPPAVPFRAVKFIEEGRQGRSVAELKVI